MAKFIQFESLLMTNRAIVRKDRWLRVHTAGSAPTTFWLEFDDKNTAKRAGGSLLIHIREKRATGDCTSSSDYNNLIYNWFEQLRLGGYIKNLKKEEE